MGRYPRRLDEARPAMHDAMSNCLNSMWQTNTNRMLSSVSSRLGGNGLPRQAFSCDRKLQSRLSRAPFIKQSIDDCLRIFIIRTAQCEQPELKGRASGIENQNI